MDWLAWYSFVCYGMIILAMIFAGGTIFGLDLDFGMDLDTDGDLDSDFDVDVEAADADGGKDANALDASIHETRPRGLLLRLMSIFGIGKVPLTMVLMIACFTFGATGLIVAIMVGDYLPEIFVGPISLTAAFATMFFGTGTLAEIINRYMPSMETYAYSLDQCVGTEAKVTIPVSPSGGKISFLDPGGDHRTVSARTFEGTSIPINEAVVITTIRKEGPSVYAEVVPFTAERSQ